MLDSAINHCKYRLSCDNYHGKVSWKPGKTLVFDDSFSHAVRYRTLDVHFSTPARMSSYGYLILAQGGVDVF